MVSAIYNFVPDESLRQITLTSLASVICGICEICGYLLSSVFRFKRLLARNELVASPFA